MGGKEGKLTLSCQSATGKTMREEREIGNLKVI